MDANGENMDRRLRKEIHAREHTTDARLHQDALLESRLNPCYKDDVQVLLLQLNSFFETYVLELFI